MKYFSIILIFCLLSTSLLKGQNFTFSQPYSVAQSVNPAIVGTGLYQHRIQSGLRSQFVGGDNLYSTVAVAWDTKIKNKQSDIKNYMGVGVNILSDRLMAGVIQNNFISLNLAYHIYLDQNLYQNLAVALGGSFAQTNFDRTKLFFADQYDNAGGLIGTGSLESLVASPSTVFANTGVLYSLHNEISFLQAGVSANFANKPNLTFNYINENKGLRLTGLLNAETKVFYNNTILLHGQYNVKEGINQYTTGLAFSFPITTDWELTKRLYIGCFTRNTEVLIPSISILSDQHSFGFSYDFNMSNANAAQLRRNLFEISFSKSFGYRKDQLFRTLFD